MIKESGSSRFEATNKVEIKAKTSSGLVRSSKTLYSSFERCLYGKTDERGRASFRYKRTISEERRLRVELVDQAFTVISPSRRSLAETP